MPISPDVPPSAGRPLRRDAQRNRDALLAAAGAHFADQGLHAPLEQIAKHAQLAIGTLYRHFPARVDLIQAVFADKLRTWLDAAERAAAMEDAWQGFQLFVETMCELQADDRGFADLTSMRLPDSMSLERTRSRIHDLGVRVVHRAQEQGSLRADATPEDLAFLIWSHGRITEATRDIAPLAWRRHLHLMLDAFRADRAHPLPEPSMTPDQVYQAMVQLGGHGNCTEA
ncbi:TetR/AcrR family transcriptional regulator [Streptomyces europaeiscabiei]|uniref:TetR/AcrR family transcriptional regulator n=1 Tax=Streptomyces europaeiscabiei TaxID=146819 RepID=UPI002E172A58|nr:TetR/AcrR family transcriptional regulator [Streptomyces europaeiscabiei]